MSQKVVYFDYWTRGIRHFAEIDKYLQREKCETLLVHLGSERGEPVQEPNVVQGIRARDISCYGGSLVTMLLRERPDIVLLLNLQTEDRILIRACRNLGIRTIYMPHGTLAPKEAVGDVQALVDSAFGLRERLRRGPRYMRLLLEYMRAASLESPTRILAPEIYTYFFRQAMSPGGNLMGIWKYRDSCANTALLYSETDRELVVSCMGYDPEDTVIVGNYNLDGLMQQLLARRQPSGVSSTPRNVVYVENGFSDPKYTIPGWTEDRVADEVIGVAKVCNELGYLLKLKLHPSSDYSVLPRRVEHHPGIEVITQCDLAELITSSDVVLGQSSSVLMMALAARKPLVVLSIPPLDLRISTFAARGLGRLVEGYQQLRELMTSYDALRERYPLPPYDDILHFAGPLDGRATERIAAAIIGHDQSDAAA
jgi:hypothetical protein